jgi:DNA-binding response OmpR family regulator
VSVLPTASDSRAPLAQEPQQGDRPLVVVADDRADERTMIGMMLGRRGFDVILVADGRDALDAAFMHGADAVVADMEMPNLNGLGLCRALRALRVHETLPIIMYVDGDLDDPRVREARVLHGAQVISKSLAVTQIVAVLRQMMAMADGVRSRWGRSQLRQGRHHGMDLQQVPAAP